MFILFDSGTTADRRTRALQPYEAFYDTTVDALFVGDGTTLGGQPLGSPALAVNAQTGTAYTLQPADAGKLITTNNAASNTVTLNAGVFSGNAIVHVAQLGAGVTTIVAGAGVTINSAGTLLMRTQYSMLSLIQLSQDNWILVGGMA